MSTLNNSLVHLAVVWALSVGSLGLLGGESAAAEPEKASSQQEKFASASLGTTPSTVFALE